MNGTLVERAKVGDRFQESTILQSLLIYSNLYTQTRAEICLYTWLHLQPLIAPEHCRSEASFELNNCKPMNCLFSDETNVLARCLGP